MKLKYLFMAAMLGLGFSTASVAEETQIMLRAMAHDAKFIGTGVGGVRAIVEDAETGEILDEGWINGGTGNTATLVDNPVSRGQQLSDDKSAGYLATVDITGPRLLRFRLIGPYGYRQAQQEATVTSWVVPGKHILGDGIVLKLQGFIVDAWTSVTEGGQVELYTKAQLMCGCPIYPDGPWDPKNYQATAILMQDDVQIGKVDLEFTGPVGMYRGTTTITQPGHYKAIVYLFDQQTGNVGVDRTMFEITAE